MVSTPLSASVARELWRHRDRRGTYTKLQGRWGDLVLQADAAPVLPADPDPDGDGDDLPFGSAPGPERILVETFDFIEICCGQRSPLVKAMTAAGFRVGPRIDISVHALWNIQHLRIIEWLLFMVHHHRVWGIHSGVPCTDFSIAHSTPVVRDSQHPWGFRPREPARKAANFMLAVACALFVAVRRARFGWMTHEHPASAHSWNIPFWASFGRHQCFKLGRYCACRFGAPYKKDTRLARLHAEFLAPLDKMRFARGPTRWC